MPRGINAKGQVKVKCSRCTWSGYRIPEELKQRDLGCSACGWPVEVDEELRQAALKIREELKENDRISVKGEVHRH